MKIGMEIDVVNKLSKLIRKDLLLRAKTGKRLSPAASVTVEASLVLPIFIFSFVNILGAFDILKLQCDMEAALHQAGSQIMETAALSRIGGDGEGEDKVKGALSAIYAGKRTKSYLGENYLTHSPIVGGASGVSFKESLLSSDKDVIDIIVSYKVHPMFGIAAFTNFGVESRFYGHTFTGYSPSGYGTEEADESEEMVYITKTGHSYHRSLGCSHLKLHIRSASRESVGAERSKDGSKYYPCEYCGSRNCSTVYITDYGNRYHSNINCSRLKRGIRTVPISEVGGRTPCSECGS